MSTLKFFTFFCLFFLPHIASKKCHESRCNNFQYYSPIVRFPFRLKNHQPQHCRYSRSFDLSCNQQNETVLTLPSSSENFTVGIINYSGQSMWIHDQNKCILKRLLDNDLSLAGSPSQFDNINSCTFFNCTPQAGILSEILPIACLSSDSYKVIATESNIHGRRHVPSSCEVSFTAMLPFTSSLELRNADSRLRLACESSGLVCGFKNVWNSQVHCSPPATNDGLSNRGMFRLIECSWAPGLVFITGLLLYIFTLFRDRVNPPQPALTELSVFANEQPYIAITGLDDLTIESYPKTQLGDRWENPKPDGSDCPICLYKSKETLRSIPECHHHFHANCIDMWLRNNPTCPVCRKAPTDDNKTTLALIEA